MTKLGDTLTLSEVHAVLNQVRMVLDRSGHSVSMHSFRRALRDMGAPFTSESYLKSMGMEWANVQAFLRGLGPPPKPNTAAGEGLTREALNGLNAGTVIDSEAAEAASPKGEEINPVEVWDRLKMRTAQTAERIEKSTYHDVKINSKGPFGVIMCGDAHIGSHVTDYDRLDWVVDKVVSSPHGNVKVIQIGDLLDSMIWNKVSQTGRQSVLDIPEEISAASYWLNRLAAKDKMLAMVAGNHDLVSGKMTGYSHMDAVIDRLKKRIPFDKTEVVLNLMVGKQDYTVVLRHAVRGSSVWNPAQGLVKWHRWCGHVDADLAVAGHTHSSGYQFFRLGDKTKHAVQLGAYKLSEYDDYVRERGFPIGDNLSPDMMVIFYPDRRKISVFPDTEQGLDFLDSIYGSCPTCLGTPKRSQKTSQNGYKKPKTKSTGKTLRRSSSSTKTGRSRSSSRKASRTSRRRSRSTRTA